MSHQILDLDKQNTINSNNILQFNKAIEKTYELIQQTKVENFNHTAKKAEEI